MGLVEGATSRPGVVGSSEYDAILVAGFGGPEGPDDVMPFLRNVTRGRGVPDERLEAVAQHYLALGGVSPINRQTEALRGALQTELHGRGIALPVLTGNRNWSPYLAETLKAAAEQGVSRALGVATSAYASYSSCRQYREDFAAALIQADLVGRMRIEKVRPYYDLPGFLAPFADGIAAAIRRADAAAVQRLTVLFTTHSIPLAMADASGAAADGRLYVEQHLAACEAVMRQVEAQVPDAPSWQLVYQSRSGAPHIPWLEPDIGDVIAGLPTVVSAGVIVVPIGFVSDHVEVIWDLDTEAAEAAALRGLWFERVPTPGADPRFVAGLADLVAERLAPESSRIASATRLPARPDRCPPGCCQGRDRKPTTAGQDSFDDWAEAAFAPRQLAASGILAGGLLP